MDVNVLTRSFRHMEKCATKYSENLDTRSCALKVKGYTYYIEKKVNGELDRPRGFHLSCRQMPAWVLLVLVLVVTLSLA